MGMPGEQAQRDSGQRALRRERRHANAQRGQDRLGPALACRWASSCSNMGCAAERAFSARRRCQAARAAHAERETGGRLDLTQGFAQRRWGLVQRLRRHAQAGVLVLQGQQFGVAKAQARRQAANALLRSVVAGVGVHAGDSLWFSANENISLEDIARTFYAWPETAGDKHGPPFLLRHRQHRSGGGLLSFACAFRFPLPGLSFCPPATTAASSSFFPWFVRAAAPPPGKPIRVISPYAAGGGPDLLLRQVGPALGQALGQPIVIENKVGAGGVLAAIHAAQQPADGYLLLMGANTHLVQKAMQPELGFDPIADFAPVSNFATSPAM